MLINIWYLYKQLYPLWQPKIRWCNLHVFGIYLHLKRLEALAQSMVGLAAGNPEGSDARVSSGKWWQEKSIRGEIIEILVGFQGKTFKCIGFEAVECCWCFHEMTTLTLGEHRATWNQTKLSLSHTVALPENVSDLFEKCSVFPSSREVYYN